MSRKHRPRPESEHQGQGDPSIEADQVEGAGEGEEQVLDQDWLETDAEPVEQGTDALEAADDKFLRLAAEYDNYRRRTAREKAESFDRGASAFAERLLGVLDDFDRLAGHVAPGEEDHPTTREGLDLILAKLAKELQAAGLERIDPTGEPFDPNDHDAVALAPTDDPSSDHHVKATFQIGYRFRGNLIRPASVQVWSTDGAL